MSKGDFPALRMTIEAGRLIPAGQFDAERLNSFRRGTVVYVTFTEEKDRVLVKKWWAILGLVVKQCKTPWKTKEEASEAVKLALGIVNLSKTVGGQFMQYPRSLKDLEDPEMLEALEAMTELLSRITGVDVETLKKETAHVEPDPAINHSDDAPSSSDMPASTSSDAGQAGGEIIPVTPPADDNADMFGDRQQLSPADRLQLIECGRKFFAIPLDTALTAEQQRGVLETAKDTWKDQLPPALHDYVKSFFVSADAVIRGKADRAMAIDEFAGLLGCSINDLGGAA